MRGSKVVVGVFEFIDDTLKAIQVAKSLGLDYKVYSPVPNHEIEHETMPPKSPVRFVTATGAFIGLCFGFFLAIWTSMDYPMRVSSKMVVSPPGFIVIGYECTILFGAISTLLAMFYFGRFPNVFRAVGYDPRFSQDKFGVVIGCDPKDVDSVSDRLRQSGAEEVKVAGSL